MPDPHPLVVPFAGLLGTWTGEGEGTLPGRDGFRWTERCTVTTAGTPALAFSQRTRRPDGGPFHPEDGWVRLPPELQPDEGPAAVEVVVASPTGILEALTGTLTPSDGGCELDVRSATIARTPAAGEVSSTRRRWRQRGDVLEVDFWMATPAHPDEFHHLSATLHRTDGGTP